jgi:transposase-like protein
MTPLMGILERTQGDKHSRVFLKVTKTRRKPELQEAIRQMVEKGSDLYTDSFRSYDGLHEDYVHQVVDHLETYANGQVHTNGLENFWSLFKRSLKGTYVNVEPFHLFRYCDEQAFRFNERKSTDSERFVAAVPAITGRRLTWKNLTGNVGDN